MKALTARLLAILLLAWISVAWVHAAPGTKPNVLLICVDDLNTQLGCYGNRVVKTPNVDRLASMGVKFDRAYCNYPICNPSRTSMLSGRYPEQTRVLGNNTPPRSFMPDVQFMPEFFKQHGYYTAGIGKVFHGSFMETVKWDEWINPKEAGEDDEEKGAGGGDRAQRKERKPKADRPAGERKTNVDKGDASRLPFGWHATDNSDEQEPDGQIAARAVQVLEQQKDNPFFLAVGFHKPHVGHVAPKKYFEMYSADRIGLPQEPPLDEQGIPRIAYTPKWYPDLSDDDKRHIILNYYACTTFMDAQLGKVLAAMDRLKLWDNTIVIFWGDHGWHHGEHGGMWAKASLMEESARLPLIIVAPGNKANTACERVVQTVDLYPTMVDFCQLPVPAKLVGKSLMPLLKNPHKQWNEAAYTVVSRRGDLGRSLRTEQWTYIEWPDGSQQLYNSRKDPKHLRNVAKQPANTKVLAEMKARVKQLQNEPGK